MRERERELIPPCLLCGIQNCTKILKILQSDAFGPPNPATIAAYEEECIKLFPLATAFKVQVKTVTSESTQGPSSVSVTQVKDVAAKTITATGVGVVVLKETALSSAAMSDLSGDINDNPSITSRPISTPDNKKDSPSMVNSTTVEVGAN